MPPSTPPAEIPRPLILRAPSPATTPAADPLWYRRGLVYQLSVRAFFDSGGDGIGDFVGLTRRLDYLADLGATSIWLLPFFPSPWRDDGYDVTDFCDVDRRLGTLRDFNRFVRQAHRRGLRVIVELVLNHTSDQHPWFQKARRSAAGSDARQYYVWSDDPRRFADARVLFRDDEPSNWTWDPQAGAYYFHRFYHHEPDLNYDHPPVQEAMIAAADHWLRLGVDGLALNTIAYLYEREGTACENLPENHAFLRRLRRHVDEHYRDRALIAEVNQWPEDAAAYFGDGDECHAALHFPLAPRLFMALDAEDRRPIADVVRQTPAGGDGNAWLLFLRNQDELTLQMVTEQERDALLRRYARDPQWRRHSGIRRRLAPLLENHRAKIELLYGILFSLPGTPAIYYGDEIGMGDNPFLGDRAGVRTPMQWSPGPNAGFSEANPQRLFLPVIADPHFHYPAVNVQTQAENPQSLLNWLRRLAAARAALPALTDGAIEFCDAANPKLLVFLRRHEGQTVLVAANLSRHAQVAQLPLPHAAGATPLEVFGRTAFPPIGELPYMLTLPPYAFFWLELCPQTAAAAATIGHSIEEGPPPAVVEVDGDWPAVFEAHAGEALRPILESFLRSRRWYGGKARAVRDVRVVEAVPMAFASGRTMYWTLLEVEFADSECQRYLAPLGIESEAALRRRGGQPAAGVVARLRYRGDDGPTEGLLYDLVGDDDFHAALLAAIGSRRGLPGRLGRLKGATTRAWTRLGGDAAGPTKALKPASSNSVILYGERLLLKLVRRLEDGINPDLEIGDFLTDTVSFAHIPPVAGSFNYTVSGGEPATVAIVTGFVGNDGNAWEHTVERLGSWFDEVLDLEPPPSADADLLTLAEQTSPAELRPVLGDFLAAAELLGRRTAEMHVALAADAGNPHFTPEGFSQLYQRSLYQTLRNQVGAALDLLERRLAKLAPPARSAAEALLVRGGQLVEACEGLRVERIAATRTRCHGDYHLGQVLVAGNDYVIIDFEGEPTRTLSERRRKASPLRDVAGMLRSYDYAAHAARIERFAERRLPAAQSQRLDRWVATWVEWSSAAFLRAYLAVAGGASFVPAARAQLRTLLHAYLVEKAVYELQYELNNRPDWAGIPLAGLGRLLEGMNR